MYSNLKGIYPALLTPFDGNGKINETALQQLIERCIMQGVNGFYVGGSTAEAFLLSEIERHKLYQIVAEIVNKRVNLVAHVGAISTEHAISYAKTASKAGYNAISAISPFYYKFSFEQIKKYYYDIVYASKMPMIIYNFPVFSGVSLSIEQVSQFFVDEMFIGIKHTSSDFFSMQQFKDMFPNKLVFSGYDEMFLSALSMGADGAIGSTYNFMADKFIEIKQQYSLGNHKDALALQTKVNRIIHSLIKVGVMEGEKEVLCQLGIDFGEARPPFSSLTKEQKQFIKTNVTDKL